MSAAALKALALLTMVLDHVGYALLPEVTILRLLGRLSFPLYAFLLGEGFRHTRDVKRYAFRLALFAVVSEAPFDFFLSGSLWDPGHQNVYLTLLLGLLSLWGYEHFAVLRRRADLGLLLICCCAAGAELLRADYGAAGVLMIALLFLCREEKRRSLFFLAAVGLQALTMSLSSPAWGGTQLWAGLALLPMLLYNGQPGRRGNRWVFYAFYPAHLVLLGVLPAVL